MTLSIQKLHEFVDLLNHPNEDIKKEAEQKVSLWENDILPGQLWVSTKSDDSICSIVNIENGKVEVCLIDHDTLDGTPTFFGFSSFLRSWKRLV